MRVLIADKLPPQALDTLREADFDIISAPSLRDDALLAALSEHQPEVLIVRSTRVTAAMLEPGSLGLVIRAGAGFNTIDVAAASRSGIYVANCPGKNGLAVAELAIGLLLAVDRRLPAAVTETLSGSWDKKKYAATRGLAGRTLGIVGPGNIGTAVAKRARALDMKVLAWDYVQVPRPDLDELDVEFVPDLLELARRSDAVSLHCAATPETKHMISTEFLAALPEGAVLINTSRSEIVDEDALLEAARERGIRAALDVISVEPGGGKGAVEHPLLAEPGIIATPHLGASTAQAQEAVADEAIRIVRTWRDTGKVPNVLNITQASPATHLLTVRHLNRVGVLATVFSALKEAGINVDETENIVFSGEQACIARVQLEPAPGDDLLADIRSSCPRSGA